MTMLEKAARALAVRQGEDPDMRTWDSINNVRGPDVWECLVPQARAVLEAVRVPSDSSARIGDSVYWDTSDPHETNEDMKYAFTAMIDHILTEGKSNDPE